MNDLSPASILADLEGASLPRTVRCYATVGSTMDVAREQVQTLPDTQLPLLVVADVQTSGRGRLGRRWEAPAGSALLASLALRTPQLPPDRGVILVWMIAVALCEAIEDVVGRLRPALKWPNDVLVETRVTPQSPPIWAKVAGILLEISLGVETLDWAVIGFGINVHAAPPPEAARYPATSLSAAAGAPVSRLDLLRAILRRADAWYTRLQSGDEAALFAAWRARLLTLGRDVRIEMADGSLMGRAEDVDPSGALLVRDAAGVLHTVTTGDVGLL